MKSPRLLQLEPPPAVVPTPRRRGPVRWASLALAAALLSGCVVETESVEGARAAIYGGTPDPGHPEVVYLVNLSGGACTGTIIAPRVVLTAKHCVEDVRSPGRAAAANRFQVRVGSSASRPSNVYSVAEVRVADGTWDVGDGSDVAVLILSAPAAEAPRMVNLDAASSLAGQEITAVGFGLQPDGTSGQKMITTTRVLQVRPAARGDLIVVNPATCQGDSGGPAIAPDGTVRGVVSFGLGGVDGECTAVTGVYNGIARQRALIEGAIEDSGSCVPREEVCDGADNDCDGEVDEGCTAYGERCSADAECAGQLCAVTADGRRCSAPCDPLRPDVGCPIGSYCSQTTGCDGACLVGEPGAGENDAECTSDTDCRSAFCLDPGDGRMRCLDPCEGDQGMCLGGEVCAAAPGACGGCVPRALVAGDRGAGEPCDLDEECGSGMCFDDEGVSYCASSCTSSADCGDRFHCRAGVCARGRAAGIGGGCVTNEDCVDGLCARRADGQSFCTSLCSVPEDCPLGFACEDVGGGVICVPDLALNGEPCAVNADCTTGLCALNSPDGDVCTRLCGGDAPCSPGYECTRIGGGNNICLVAGGGGGGGGGGGCSVSSRGASPALLLVALGLAIAGLRRRRC